MGVALRKDSRVMACGPDPMLAADAKMTRDYEAYLSLEGEMACGIGACLVCAVPCRDKPFRHACVDGPVFNRDQMRGELGGGFDA